jgi:hypothetical protein
MWGGGNNGGWGNQGGFNNGWGGNQGGTYSYTEQVLLTLEEWEEWEEWELE